jgi:hypothetical protein
MAEFLFGLLVLAGIWYYFAEQRRDERKDDDDRWKMSGGPGGYRIS